MPVDKEGLDAPPWLEHAAGVRTATHTIGDAAVRHVLDPVEAPVGEVAQALIRLTVSGGHVTQRHL
ncbi:hypothetical protein ACFWPU_30010 [Streptomyces sp. NPDC058471]|uniref:hypothetical protein n=1 Tax=Streptomyces sp. NPDC058471 TaxID=3346516 RepID=UPI00364D94D0